MVDFQFTIPGSCLKFQPDIYVTVIAHTPFFATPAQQVSCHQNIN